MNENNKQMKIAITGASGFIGTHLVNYLNSTDENAMVIPITHEQGDIREIVFEGRFEEKPDVIIHLANRNFIPDSWDQPGDFFSVNVDGTRNVLEYCRTNGVRLIYLSAYVYGQPDYLPIDEQHPRKSLNPYMATKIQTEDMIRFYGKELDTEITIIRPFNIFGAGQNSQFLIPTIVQQLMSGEKEIKVKSLAPKRDFLYIQDLCDAIHRVVQKKPSSDVLNIGYGESVSVQEVIESAAEAAGVSVKIQSEEQERKNEVMDVVADITKVEQELNWHPKTSLLDGLSAMINQLRSGDAV